MFLFGYGIELDFYSRRSNHQRLAGLANIEDALQIALASIHQFHYLATWNFAHFVGEDTKFRLFAALRDWGVHAVRFGACEPMRRLHYPRALRNRCCGLTSPMRGRSQGTETVQTALALRRFWPPRSAAG